MSRRVYGLLNLSAVTISTRVSPGQHPEWVSCYAVQRIWLYHEMLFYIYVLVSAILKGGSFWGNKTFKQVHAMRIVISLCYELMTQQVEPLFEWPDQARINRLGALIGDFDETVSLHVKEPFKSKSIYSILFWCVLNLRGAESHGAVKVSVIHMTSPPMNTF